VLEHKHQHWISEVKWDVSSDVMLASTNYNGEVTLWDIRAKIPLSSAELHDGKALCMEWVDGREGKGILSGGSDCLIKSTSMGSK